MPKEIFAKTKSIFKYSSLGIYALSFVFVVFAWGLSAAKNLLVFKASGVWGFILSSSLTFICEAAAAPIIIGAYEWVQDLIMGNITPMSDAFKKFSDILSIVESQRIFLTSLFTLRLAMLPFRAAVYTEKWPLIIFGAIATLRLLCGVFPVMHILINAPQISTFRVVKLALGAMKKNFGDFFKLIMIYALLFTVIYITKGMLIILILPIIFCSAAVFCDAVFEENKLYKYNLYY